MSFSFTKSIFVLILTFAGSMAAAENACMKVFVRGPVPVEPPKALAIEAYENARSLFRVHMLKLSTEREPTELREASAPYRELFADLAGTLAIGKYEEYGLLMIELRDKFRHDHIDSRVYRYFSLQEVARDFQHNVPVKGFNETISIFGPLEEIDLAQILLNPTRTFINDNYLHNPKVLANIPRFMDKIMRVLSAEAVSQEAQLKRGPVDAEALNVSLITHLKRALAEFE